MGEAPRRKWLQMHLSTAVILMIAAGGLIWANVRPRKEILKQFVAEYFGWPINVGGVASMNPDYQPPSNEIVIFDPKHAVYIVYWRVAVNAVIAMLILAIVWFLSEWWIRRRAARKGR